MEPEVVKHASAGVARAWLATPVTGPLVEDAACRGTDPAAFTDPRDPDEISVAVRICLGCPVRTECGEYAVRSRAWGIWGGMVYREGRPPVGLARSPRGISQGGPDVAS